MSQDNYDKNYDLGKRAREEAKAMAKDGLDHPSTKPVLTGAAIGVVAAALLPVVTWPVGLAAGAGYAFYKRIRK